jgi:long-subunit fatty acid transport protein
MKRILLSASALALGATAAAAGGIERSSQSVAILFEKGSYAEFSLGLANPDVKGRFAGTVPSGDVGMGYGTFSLGYKQAMSENLDFAVIVDQPVGANVSYSDASPFYPYAGSNAHVRSLAVTGLLRYRLENNVSFIGGIRAEKVSGDVHLHIGATLPSYDLKAKADTRFGYVLGVAWEKPEIAARIALTYNSAMKHSFDTVETGLAPVALNGKMDVEIPQSVNLEFQTGIAADTLLFGSIRWSEWTAFNITPQFLAMPIVSYSDNVITYNLGVGRKFNDNWSAAVTFGYEDPTGTPVGNLGPHDGYKSVGLGVTYTHDNMKITAGVRYVDVGDATTSTIGARFTGNHAVGAGIKVGFTF